MRIALIPPLSDAVTQTRSLRPGEGNRSRSLHSEKVVQDVSSVCCSSRYESGFADGLIYLASEPRFPWTSGSTRVDAEEPDTEGPGSSIS